MGRVYLGHDLLLDRPVAIKFIDQELPTAQARQRFRIEAVALARLHQPNVMAVYRASYVAGRPYIVGELVSGKSLDQLEKPVSWRRTLEIACALARGLAAVHRCGVLHRDLKPSNAILTADGQAKLVDFGIAKLVESAGQRARATEFAGTETGPIPATEIDSWSGIATLSMEPSAQDGKQPIDSPPAAVLTSPGTRMGTPLYMSPEVWQQEPATARSDVYSLGAMLYELCSGKPPHSKDTLEGLELQVKQTDAPKLAETAPVVDRRLALIIDRCIRRDPKERFASGVELCAELERLSGRLVLGRRLALLSVISVFLILVLLIAGSALYSWVSTRRAVAAHLLEARRAIMDAHQQSQGLEELRRKTFAAFDNQQSVEGEKLWTRVLGVTQKSLLAYQLATRSLERALALDPKRRDVRERVSEVLYEQAVLLDQNHRDTQRDDMLTRLANITAGESNEFLHAWTRPGHISLTITPATATATISVLRYVADDQGRLIPSLVKVLGTTPLSSLALEPGSYLLVLTAPGRITVRTPLLVHHGEFINQDVYLPTLSEVPSGFVYVPAGRFLFGAAGDERIRRKIFRSVPPLHEIFTRPYLIAQHETTFAEWIEFLEALPPEQRERHRPRSQATSSQEQIDLRQGPDGVWQIALRPTLNQQHLARRGESIDYPTRARRKAVNWQRLPVVGVDLSDAQAYLNWLTETGKVLGARLCTEYEWERAARGADAREYPHGDVLNPDDANFDETYGRQPLSMGPDEVGAHPASQSPFTVDDLSGNVWEWVASTLEHDQFVLRGGAYYFDVLTAQVNNRQPVEPTLRNNLLGLRVCADLPSHDAGHGH